MKKYLFILILSAAILYGQTKALISYDCDLVQGFNFQSDAQTDVGHVTYMKLGASLVLTPDFSVTDPASYPEAVDVVGVMSSYYWEGGVTDPIDLVFNISTMNKQAVSAFLHTSMSNTNVVFNYNVYSYDPDAKKYYTAAFNIVGNLLGIIHKEGANLIISVDNLPNEDVLVPQNYAMHISIDPQSITQELSFRLSESAMFTKQWGIGTTPPLPPGGIIIGPPRVGFWLDWNDSEGATGYDIYSSDDPYGTYTFEAHVTVSEYEITSIGSKRFYYVVATN